MKTLNIALLGLVALVFSLSSCKKEDGTVTVNFKAMYNGSDMSMYSNNAEPLGYSFTVERFQFYVDNVTLIGDDGSVEIKDVELIDFDGGATFIKEEIESGKYSSIRFGLGLDADRNAMDPAGFDASHPMSSAQGTYWTWATMYRFFIIEGRTDTAGGTNYTKTFAYHIGLNDYYRTIELPINLDVAEEGEASFNVELDVYKIFYGPDDTIDKVVDFDTHTIGTEALATRFTDNLVESFSISY